jgi:hypothetical protein
MRTQAICLALAIVLVCTNAQAQWVQTTGDIGVSYSGILSLALVGTNLYAGIDGYGVFLSTNNGASWTVVNEGLPRLPYDTTYYYPSIWCLVASGTNLYAGIDGYGVFLSTNNGASWTAVNEGLPRLPYDTTQYFSVGCLAVSGTNLFAGTGQRSYYRGWDGAGAGVFLSTNNGASWTAVNEGLPSSTYDTTQYTSVGCLAVSGTNLFAGTYAAGVFRSTNNGTSWTVVNEGLPSSTYDTTKYYPSIQCLAVSGTNLYAGIDGYGVFLSTNNGASWTAVNEGLPSSTYDTTKYYPSIRCLVASGTNLYAGIDRYGVFLSTNNGASWTAVNEGLPRLPYDTTYYYSPIQCLAVSGTNLFAGTGERSYYRMWDVANAGVFLSTNNGTTWSAVNEGLPSIFSGWGVNCFFTSGANLFAGTDGFGVILSTNNGTSWEYIENGLLADTKCFAPSGQYLFAGTAGSGVFRSTNNGTSWSSAGNNGLPNMNDGAIIIEINSLASIGQNLFAGTIYGVFLSTDNGSNWTAVNTGLAQEEGDPYVGIKCLAVSPNGAGGTNLFAGGYYGFFRSTDYGTSWATLEPGSTLGSVQSLAIVGTNLFAGTPYGVYRSTNDGALWTAVNTGLTNTSVAAFAVAGSKLIAGTANGVYVTTNNGTSWNALDSASTLGSVRALAILDTNLFVGTVTRGVWRRPLSQITTSVGTVASQLPGEYLLSQNYPNPFNPSTTITYELPKASQVSLTVYDILGRQVSALVNGKRDAGVHEVKFDAAGLSSGVYFYRLQAGDFVQSRKLMILR